MAMLCIRNLPFSFFLQITIFFFFSSSSQFIANGSSSSRLGSNVEYLPGFDQHTLPFQLETGYVGVDEDKKVQLFYYFVKSTSDHPLRDPLVLWLTGGPGCSALSGVIEQGPIMFILDDGYDGSGLPRLTSNPYSWTKVANMIFLDLPVGTGFSYRQTPTASASTGLQSCHQAYEFLRKWLVDHPEFISTPFYVGGDSYVGITVPAILHIISNGIESGIKPRINLKGYLLGNPLTFPDEKDYQIPYAHGMGLISNELYESLKRNCKGKYTNVNSSNVRCFKDLQNFNQLIDGLNKYSILEPSCDNATARLPNLSSQRRYLDEGLRMPLDTEQQSKTKCKLGKNDIVPFWANDPRVREALHIRKGSIGKWVRCNYSLPYTDYMWDSTPYHANLSKKGYRSPIYSGDHDMQIPFLSTEAWIKSLNYSITDDWRQWRVQNQVAGYTRTYANNLTFATVKGGEHVASATRPLESAAMFKRWMLHQPL